MPDTFRWADQRGFAIDETKHRMMALLWASKHARTATNALEWVDEGVERGRFGEASFLCLHLCNDAFGLQVFPLA